MWFVETPWPPVIILATLAVGFLGLGQRRGVFLVTGLCLLGLCGAVIGLEMLLVSDRERVEQNVVGVAKAFQRGDKTATNEYVSKQAPELNKMVDQAFEMVEVTDLHIRDMSVDLVSQGTRAVSRFRANGTINVKAFGMSHTQNAATKWDVTWQKEGDDWKIIRIQRLDPLKNEPLGTFAGSN